MNRSALLTLILALIALPAALLFLLFVLLVPSFSGQYSIEVVDGPDGWRAIVDRHEAFGADDDARVRLQPPEDGAPLVVLVPFGEASIRSVGWESGPLLVVTGRRHDVFDREFVPSYRHIAVRYDWAR